MHAAQPPKGGVGSSVEDRRRARSPFTAPLSHLGSRLVPLTSPPTKPLALGVRAQRPFCLAPGLGLGGDTGARSPGTQLPADRGQLCPTAEGSCKGQGCEEEEDQKAVSAPASLQGSGAPRGSGRFLMGATTAALPPKQAPTATRAAGLTGGSACALCHPSPPPPREHRPGWGLQKTAHSGQLPGREPGRPLGAPPRDTGSYLDTSCSRPAARLPLH